MYSSSRRVLLLPSSRAVRAGRVMCMSIVLLCLLCTPRSIVALCYGLSLVTPGQVGEAVPLDASRDDWHRERSKTRSRRTAWCGRDVKKG